MLRDLKTIKDKVSYILESCPETRDDDKELVFLYHHCDLKRLNQVDNPLLAVKDILCSQDTPSFESIRRVRQKLQQNGLYVGSKRESRLEEATNVKEWARRGLL